MKSISIVNLKGGVGKTVTAVNLAAILATDYEKRVLLVDVDHQGNASRYCGVNTEERGGLAALLTGGAVCYDEVVEMATMSGVDVIPADMSLATLGVDGEYTSQMAVRAMRDLRDGEEYIRETCPVRVFRTMIRRTDKVDEAVFARKAVAEWSPTSAAARDYRAWVKELMEVE